jgi:hypothetical protein
LITLSEIRCRLAYMLSTSSMFVLKLVRSQITSIGRSIVVSAERCKELRQTCHCLRLCVRHNLCLFINHVVWLSVVVPAACVHITLCLVRTTDRTIEDPAGFVHVCVQDSKYDLPLSLGCWVCVKDSRHALPLSFRMSRCHFDLNSTIVTNPCNF